MSGDTLEVYEELDCVTFLVNPEDLGHWPKLQRDCLGTVGKLSLENVTVDSKDFKRLQMDPVNGLNDMANRLDVDCGSYSQGFPFTLWLFTRCCRLFASEAWPCWESNLWRHTGDIEEAHLKFQRRNSEPQFRLGMPTLKRHSDQNSLGCHDVWVERTKNQPAELPKSRWFYMFIFIGVVWCIET